MKILFYKNRITKIMETLYNTLKKEADEKKRDLTSKQKKCFVEKFNKLDQEGHNFIFALIKYNSIQENCEESIPYCGVKNNKDITFDIDKFSMKLKYILYFFIQKHLKAMEESKRNNLVL